MNIHCTFTENNDKSAYQKCKQDQKQLLGNNYKRLSQSTEFLFNTKA